MAALAVPPFGPVAIEEFFIDAGFDFGFFFGGVALGIAGIVVAIGINGGNEGQCVAIGRPKFVVRAGGERSKARGLAACERDPINLRSAGARGNEGEFLAVRRPARARVAAAAGQLAGFTACGWDEPDVADGVVGVEIRSGDGVGDPFGIRGELRFAEAMQRDQILESNGAFFGCLPVRCDDGHQHCDRRCYETRCLRHVFSPHDGISVSLAGSPKRVMITLSFCFS